MIGCKPCPPITFGPRLSAHDGELLSNSKEYRSVVGGLQYLTFTRPDIAFAVNQVCQFSHNPTISYLQTVKSTFWYIKSTIHRGLVFHRSYHLTSIAYSDSDRHSTTEACIFLVPNLWQRRSKQYLILAHRSWVSRFGLYCRGTVVLLSI